MDGGSEFAEPPLSEFACDPCWVTYRRDAMGQRLPVQRVKGGAIAPASTDNARTWRLRDDAERLSSELRAEGAEAGIGLVAHRRRSGEWIALIDLDAAMDPATGAPKEWAQTIVDRLCSYSETSPSAKGLHIVVRIAATDVPAVEALMRKGRTIRAGRKWFRTASQGEKREGIEFIWRGYATFTGRRLISQPSEVAHATLDTLRWLFDFAGAFKTSGIASDDAQAACAKPDRASARSEQLSDTILESDPPTAALQHRPGGRFIFLARRVHAWTVSDSDAQFQVRAEFANAVESSDEGRSVAWVAPSRIKQLPGSRRGSKRSSKTAYAAIASLKDDETDVRPTKDAFLTVALAIPPGSKQPSRSNVYSIPAWYVRPDWGPVPERPHPPTVRLSRAAWDRARTTLSPFALRLFVHILSGLALDDRDPSAAFTPSPSELSSIFGCKPERIAAALDKIVNANLFDVTEARCRARRRPATYRRAAGA